MDRQGGDNFKIQDLKIGDRDQHVGFSPFGPSGTLLFETRSERWKLSVDTKGILSGDCKVRVRLLDQNDRPVGEPAIATLRVDGSAPDEKDLAFSTVNKSDAPAQDGGAASPMRLRRASTLVCTLEGHDKESGIKKVLLYLGAPENNLPPKGVTPVAADPLNEDNTKWKAVLPLSGDFKGAFKITAEFVNGVGLSSFKTLSLEFFDPAPTAAETKGSIQVVVKVGDNRMFNVKVKLEAKGVKQEEKTDENGEVRFEKLAPGTYKVSARDTGREAETEVEVSAGKTTDATLKLTLK
jgi:hypothetical protein